MSKQSPFQEFDDELDRISQAHPHYNFPYSDKERATLQAALRPLRERVLACWKRSANTWRVSNGDAVFFHHRTTALRVLADIDRWLLDIEITDRPH